MGRGALMETITLVERNFFTKEVEMTGDIENFLCHEETSDGKGYCFSSWKDGIMIRDNFISARALLIDFDGSMNEESILKRLNSFKIKAIVLPSRGNWIPSAFTTARPKIHVILPLIKAIDTTEAYEELSRRININLFYGKANSYMNYADRYFFYSGKNARIQVLNKEDGVCIDEFDFGLTFEPPIVYDLSRKIKRKGKVSSTRVRKALGRLLIAESNQIPDKIFVFSVESISSLLGQDDGELKEGVIECPLHVHSPSHDAVSFSEKEKRYLLCLEFHQLFYEENLEPPSVEERIFLEPGEKDDFEKSGFEVGRISRDKQLYFINNCVEHKFEIYNRQEFVEAVSKLYSKLNPGALMSGWTYLSLIGKVQASHQIIDQPRKFNDTTGITGKRMINLFSGYPLRRVSSTKIPKIKEKMDTQGWEYAMEYFCPKTTKVIQNMMGQDFESLGMKWFLNWLCGIFCYLEKANTAVIFSGHPKNGVILFYETVLQPLFGGIRTNRVLYETALGKSSSFIIGKTLLLLEQPPYYKKESYDLLNRLQYWVTNSKTVVSEKNLGEFEIENNCNFIWFISRKIPAEFARNDQIFSIFQGFTPLSDVNVVENNRKVKIGIEGFRTALKKEIWNFSQILLAWDFTRKEAESPFINYHRELALRSGAGELADIILELTEQADLNDIVPTDCPDREDILRSLLNGLKDRNCPVVVAATLCNIYNIRTGEKQSVSAVNRQVYQNFAAKSITKRIDSRTTAKCFTIQSLKEGLERAAGTLHNKPGLEYLPVYNRAYKKARDNQEVELVPVKLFQDSTKKHIIFSDRPVYSLHIEELVVNMAEQKQALVSLKAVAVNRQDRLFVKSEYLDIAPMITILNKNNEGKLLPLEESYKLSREDLDQYLTKSEAMKEEFRIKKHTRLQKDKLFK